VLGGAVTALCAGLVPFEDLNDLCSAAVLTCFIFASASAIIARLTGQVQAALRREVGIFVTFSFIALLLLSPLWTSNAALVPQLLAVSSTNLKQSVAWLGGLAGLVTTRSAVKIQDLVEDTSFGKLVPGTSFVPGGAVVHLISILTSAALITTLPAYSLASSAAFLLAVFVWAR